MIATTASIPNVLNQNNLKSNANTKSLTKEKENINTINNANNHNNTTHTNGIFAPLSRYIRLEKLGEGNYGQVYKAQDRTTEGICALKKVRLDDDGSVPATALREIALLRDVDNENIIKLRAVIYDPERLYLSFDFLDKDLRRFMDCVGELPELVVKWYMYQILVGIEHCHSRRMLHRDLKPQNILINRRGDVQLADFGLARTCALPINTITHEVATLWYRSPEVLLGEHCYNSTMDMWSIGCIFAELASDLPLFPGDSEIATLFRIFKFTGTPDENIWPGVTMLTDFKTTFPKWQPITFQNYREKFPKLDRCGIDLLQRLLALDPKKRVSARAALSHPYFHNLDEVEARRVSVKLAIQLDFNDGEERRRRRHALRL